MKTKTIKTDYHKHTEIKYIFGNPVLRRVIVAKTLWSDTVTSTGFGKTTLEAYNNSIINRKGA